MASNKTFYKTIVKVTILSEEPYPDTYNLQQIHYDIQEGDCSGVYEEIDRKEIDAETAAKELIKQGSDPEFFQLDEDGNDVDFDDIQ